MQDVASEPAHATSESAEALTPWFSFNFSLIASTLTSMSLSLADPPRKLRDKSLVENPTRKGSSTCFNMLLINVVAILPQGRRLWPAEQPSILSLALMDRVCGFGESRKT